MSAGEQDIVLLRSGLSTLPEDELHGFPAVAGMQEALDQWKPNAAIISNPTAMHVDLAIQAAREGVHLLIEKPISHNLEGMAELRQAVRQFDVRILIGYQYRFHPALQLIKNLLVKEEIGRVLAARAHYGEYLPEWHPWEDYRQSYAARAELGGGVLLTLSHPLDYLIWLLGEVSSVSAEVDNLAGLDIDVEDTAEVTLSFANSALGSVHLNFTQRPRRHDLEIIGSEGTLRWIESEATVQRWTEGAPAWESIKVENGDDRNWMFREEMQHFIQLVHGREESICPLETGINILNIAVAARESAHSGQRITI
jgi:predicted dehydrogenase